MSHPFIEEVKKNAGIPSDYALAKTLGISKEVVSRWSTRKGNPDGINALKLAQLGNIETKRAIELMEGGFASVSLLAMTSLLGILYINKALDVNILLHCVYYVKSRIKNKIKTKLFFLHKHLFYKPSFCLLIKIT